MSDNEERYRKKLAKYLGVEKKVAIEAVNKIRNKGISADHAAKYFLNTIIEGKKKEEYERRIEITKKRENPFLSLHKDTIIELYLGDEDHKGLGYAAIKKFLIAEAEKNDEKIKIPGEVTIGKYLHEHWKIQKDTNRHIPTAAIRQKKENKKLRDCMYPESQIDDLVNWIIEYEELGKSKFEETKKRVLIGEKTSDRSYYQKMMMAKGYDQLEIMMSEDKDKNKYKDITLDTVANK